MGKASLRRGRLGGGSTALAGTDDARWLFVARAGLDEIEAALDVAFVLRDVSAG